MAIYLHILQRHSINAFKLNQRMISWASAHLGQMGSADPMGKWMKIKKRKHAKKSSFLCLCYILRAIGAGRCRERRYADHIFIQIYFRMHHFVVNFSKFSSPQVAMGHWPPNQHPADVPGWFRWDKRRLPVCVRCWCWYCAIMPLQSDDAGIIT